MRSSSIIHNRLVIPLSRLLLWFEPLILAVVTYAFWFPTPGRLDWLWLLWLLVPLVAARWVCHGRVLTRTPLDPVLAAFLMLGALNVIVAPYTRGLMMLARPLLGMATYYAMVERARTNGLRGPIQVMIMLSLLIGLQALGATQWGGKSADLRLFTDALPTIEGAATAGGFNANEIAGAMIWLLPLMAGIAIFRWQSGSVRWDVTLAFGMLLVALLLGQSRSAIAGLVVALSFITVLLLRDGWRVIGCLLVIAIIALELALHMDVLNTAASEQHALGDAAVSTQSTATPYPTARNDTIQIRLDIWSSAFAIVSDYPFSGVGLSMFRDGRVRDRYPVSSYNLPVLPHAHDEYLQIAVDMGIPGLIVFLSIYGLAANMLVRSWRVGDHARRALSVAVGAGLIAHAIYGVADAITLWDRFAFVFWLMLGMAGAVYTRTMYSMPEA